MNSIGILILAVVLAMFVVPFHVYDAMKRRQKRKQEAE